MSASDNLSPDLINYISTARTQGVDAETIKSTLLKKGWKENDVEAALQKTKQPVSKKLPGNYIHQILHILFYVLVFGIVCVIIALIYQMYLIFLAPTKEPAFVQARNELIRKTADWQTVIHPEAGISIKAPKNFKASLLTQTKTEKAEISAAIFLESSEKKSPELNTITITFPIPIEGEIFGKGVKNVPTTSNRLYVVSKYNGYETLKSTEEIKTCDCLESHIFIENLSHSKIIEIRTRYEKKNKDFADIVNNVVNSLVFLGEENILSPDKKNLITPAP
jgi:hypothetical protein